MLQGLLSAIAEMLLSAAWSATARFFGLENVVESVTAVFGLGCIVIGFTVFVLGGQ